MGRQAVTGSGTREVPFVVHEVRDVDRLLSTPGFYQTTSKSPAYLVAKALEDWHPLFKGGWTLPFVEGDIFFFRILSEPESGDDSGDLSERHPSELQRNALVSMGVSPDFWSKLLQRYRNWELAWWREVMQNSRDAAATQIDLDIRQGEYTDIVTGLKCDAMVVSAYDNGVGMDADILRRALLTRGGSVKPESAVGGFGDAKNLILFPWLGWKVETQDIVVEGQHESVLEPPGLAKAPVAIKGTRVTVWMPLTQTTSESFALQLINKSDLPNVRIRVNGKSVSADLIGGEVVSEAGLADDGGVKVGEIIARHHKKARANSGILIRARGVFMFEEYATGIPGVVYVDVNAPAKYVFDASRNALIGAAYTFVARLKESLAREPETVLRSKKWQVKKVYRGTGAIEVREGAAAKIAAEAAARHSEQLLKSMAQKKAPSAASIKEIADEAAKAIEAEEKSSPAPLTPEELTAMRMKSSRETATALIQQTGVKIVTPEQIATAVRFAAWQPDLYVVQSMPFWKPPAAVMPETMEAKYVILLRLWTETCKFALNVLGEFQPFGVGFVFMLDGNYGAPVLGAHTGYDGTSWLLINPLKFRRGSYNSDAGEYEWKSEGDRLDLSTDEGIEDLCVTVVHEITHLQGFGPHDQQFASQLTANIKVALRGMMELARTQLKTIKREVKERFAEIRKEKSVAKSTPWSVIVGRVTSLLSWDNGLRYTEQGDLNEGRRDIETMARDASRHKQEVQYNATTILPLKISSQSYAHRMQLNPKVLLKLHDAALAAGAFELVTDDNAERVSRVWESLPPDPRPAGRAKVSKAESPLSEEGAPESMASFGDIKVFTWLRQKTSWVLRSGLAGERGETVSVDAGSTGYLDRINLEKITDSELRHFLAGAYSPAKTYTWYPAGDPECWATGVFTDFRPTLVSEATIVLRVRKDEDWRDRDVSKKAFRTYATYDDYAHAPGVELEATFDTAAKAQKHVMDYIVRQLAKQ
jgi:hypothetical protein